MNKLSICIKSLYNISFEKLCHSMNEEMLQKIFKDYPSSLIIEILWKVLNINSRKHEFEFNRTLQYTERAEYNNDSRIIHTMLRNYYFNFYGDTNLVLDTFKNSSQYLTFNHKLNFCNYFNLELFFKLLNNHRYTCKLFILFQICVTEKGLGFPKIFAELWIESKTEDEIDYHHIEDGLKLGNFLGDSGWYSESAIILSYIYKIISTKLVYSDQNLKLQQSIQCLSKWLLVTTNYCDFDDAKVILSHILNTIGFIEQTEESNLYIINAYIAISEYYYVIMDYDKAWSWAYKAVNELHDKSSDCLKQLVLSHCVKVCSVTNKLSMAKNLMQDVLYICNKKVDANIWIDIVMNISHYSLHANLSKYNIQNYFNAINSSRYLFGFMNLRTANILVDYAYTRFSSNYSESDFTQALCSIIQGIFIMKEIGVPENNFMLINAQMIKAFIVQQLFIIRITRPLSADTFLPTLELLDTNLRDIETYHLKSIELSLKLFGEKSLFTARSYYNLGRLYQNQEKLLRFKFSKFNKNSLGGLIRCFNVPETRVAEDLLTCMFGVQRERIDKIEQFYLKTKLIYETIYDSEYFWLFNLYKRLLEVYAVQRNSSNYNICMEILWKMHEENIKDLSHEMPIINKNPINDYINLEEFKRIINNCE